MTCIVQRSPRSVAWRIEPTLGFWLALGALCGLCLACAAAADETARHSLAQAEMAPRAAAELGQGIVFLKMPPGRFTESGKLDVFRRHYPSLDRQPTPRPAYGMYLLKSPIEKGEVVPLIERDAEIAFVADPEVSYDGTKILFSLLKRNENWFHIHEMNADGTGRRQLTFGEADDVSPAYLPDGRIVFCSSRCGYRDEYHGQPVENLHVMDADGSNIRQISFYNNEEFEPFVGRDGRVYFARYQAFNARSKIEQYIHAVFPDGTQDEVIFGPEIMSPERVFGDKNKNHFNSPRQLADGRILCSSPRGLHVVRHDHDRTLIPYNGLTWTRTDGAMIKTGVGGATFPISGGLVLVSFPPYPTVDPRKAGHDASGPSDNAPQADLPALGETMVVTAEMLESTPAPRGRQAPDARQANPTGRMALGVMDVDAREVALLYEDPQAICFEPVPLAARARPPAPADTVDPKRQTGRFVCQDIYRGRHDWWRPGEPYYVVVSEIIPGNLRGKDQHHVGGLGRYLGRAALAEDGSFAIDVPADASIAFDIADADGRAVMSMHSWVYVRPGATKTCVGCHHTPKTAGPPNRSLAAAARPQTIFADRPLLRYHMHSDSFLAGVAALTDEENRLKRYMVFNRTPADVPVFVANLAHDDERVRQSAAEALGQVRAREASADLAKLLADRSARVRREAAMSLGVCGDRGAVAPLIDALGDSDWGVRRSAYGSLVWLTAEHLPFEADASPATRLAQIAAWSAWWKRDSATWCATLRAHVQAGGDESQLADAMRALGRLGDRQSAPLMRQWLAKPLGDRHFTPMRDPQIVAIEALGELQDAEAVPALLPLLSQYTATEKNPKNNKLRQNRTEIERAGGDVCASVDRRCAGGARVGQGGRKPLWPLRRERRRPRADASAHGGPVRPGKVPAGRVSGLLHGVGLRADAAGPARPPHPLRG